MGKTEVKKNGFIYFAILSTTLVTFATGICFVWTSPVLIKFGNTDPTVNPIGRVITTSESAWIVSAMPLGLIFGPPLAILCSQYFMKKSVLLIAAAPLVIAHVICIFAAEVSVFLVARFLMGIGSGAIWSILGTFIAELSEDSNRGTLGALASVMSNLGTLFVYVVGSYFKVSTFSIMNLLPLSFYYVLFGWFIPHSPYDLIIRNKTQEAKNSLTKLRGHFQVEKELKFIEETVKIGTKDGFRLYDLCKNRGLFKALIICIILMACQQLSGVLAVVTNIQAIFERAGDFIPSAYSAMIIGVVSTISSIISSQLIDRAGRKFLLTTSCIFASLSLFSLGIYFYLQDDEKYISKLSVLPITSLIIFIIAFNFGLASLPWVVMGEVFPSKAKSVASTIASLSNFNLSFIVTLCFPYMAEYLGMAYTFWIFAGIMVLASIYCAFLLPETKGKNFQEIMSLLKE